MFKKKKIGIALGSGSARGFANIGVLKVLERHGIPIHMISGSSMGAVAGAVYASNPDAKKLEETALKFPWKKILFDIAIPRYGLIKGKKIEEELRKVLKNKTFKELELPLFITAFDIENNKEIIFHKGDVAKAVRASVSIPGIFNPVINKNRSLVDGGMFDPVPGRILKKKGANIIIGVNLMTFKKEPEIIMETSVLEKEDKKPPAIIKTFFKSMQEMQDDLSRSILQRSKADIIISPDISKISYTDYHKKSKAILEGEKAALKQIGKIEKLVGDK
jgi:NTE family protein